jgi:hypothetical protein
MTNLEGRRFRRPFSLRLFAAPRFITRSQNKIDGTPNSPEHPTLRFVVGAGNANTCEEIFND